MSSGLARPRPTKAPVVVGTAGYVLLPLANLLTGYSVKAMERKIERGDWQKGRSGGARPTAELSSTFWVISDGLKAQRRP